MNSLRHLLCILGALTFGVWVFNPLCAALSVEEPESKFLIILVFLFFVISVSISFSDSEKKEKKEKKEKDKKVEEKTPEKSEPPPPPLEPAPETKLTEKEKESIQRFKDRLKSKEKGPLTVEDIISSIKKDDTFKDYTITNISMAFSLQEFRKTDNDFKIIKGSRKRGGCVAIILKHNTEKEVFILG